ncbi:MAG: oxidoreductase FAD/NAD(P)-binding domain protein [Candidatus Paceibacter sp.]|jgi:ferredoxin-NADP reductase|nr:oxidoreductase FAD/NAD(P)-binding domain protein [Candidatus Paceibacter sp.]
MTNHDWQIATLKESHMVADDCMSLFFELPEKPNFVSGQHVDIRLTAPDGYQAERSYSIANAPENATGIELGVQFLENGEVSPYLFNMKPGKKIEMRGPIGGHFIWDISKQDPLILIGGGSGMVPLMSMLRHHINNFKKDSLREITFIISARSIGHVLYREELDSIRQKFPHIKIIETLTETRPSDWTGYARRVDETLLEETIGQLKNKNPMTYICGPNPFVATVTKHMMHLGFAPQAIKTERFGG